MNKTPILSVLFFILLISCSDYYKSAEDYYLSGQFELAKTELAKLKESDSNNDKINFLTKKIDSAVYEKALNTFSDNDFDKTAEILNKITENSVMFPSKTKLLGEIINKRDSIVFQYAYRQFKKNNLEESEKLLLKLKSKSHFSEKVSKLMEQISKKRKANIANEKYIAKAVISSIFGPSPSIMRVKDDKSGVFIVTYYKREARRNYGYKVKFNGNKAMWGPDDGRWRHDDISYSETTDAYFITEVFSDGSKRTDKFYKRNLK